MNNKYIKLDDAVKAIDKEWSGCSFDGSGDSISDRCEDVLMEVPSIQITKSIERYGGAKWVKISSSGGYCCSKCEKPAPSFANGKMWFSNFCPNCGERMEA